MTRLLPETIKKLCHSIARKLRNILENGNKILIFMNYEHITLCQKKFCVSQDCRKLPEHYLLFTNTGTVDSNNWSRDAQVHEESWYLLSNPTKRSKLKYKETLLCLWNGLIANNYTTLFCIAELVNFFSHCWECLFNIINPKS